MTKTRTTLNREAIFGYRPPREPVEAFGGTVYVRGLTGSEQSAIHKHHQKEPSDEIGLMARVVVATLCDESGGRVMNDGDLDAAAALPLQDLIRVANTAYRLSGITVDEAKAIKKK